MSRKIELTMMVEGGSSYRHVAFECTSSDGTFPEGKVSLARRPDHCYFELSNLPAHNGHRPGFSSTKELKAYVDRVTADVQALVEADIEAAAQYAPDGVVSLGTWNYDA